MENSGKLFFEDDAPQWYVALGEKWVGPLTAADVHEKIQNLQITWAHYIWRRGQTSWKRICDTKPFEASVPHQPAKSIQKEVKEAVVPEVRHVPKQRSSAGPPPPPSKQQSPEARIWYLYYNDSQFGPFSQEEIRRFLKVGKIHFRVHAWRNGMETWERIEKIGVFQQKGPSRDVIPPLEQRTSPRRPLVAKILITDEQSVIVGICRDISIGGMQVLTEQIPGKVGTKLKMNISPSTNASGKRIDSFAAEGVIVRVLEDGRGFSFRFERLSDQAKQSIESFIESPV
jgi:hypothetical protein